MAATCRHCAHYDRAAFCQSNGKIVFRKDKVARCLFDINKLRRKVPLSVRPSWSGREPIDAPGRMAPDDGAGCPQWTQIKEPA